MWHRDPTKWDLVKRVLSPQPRVKGQDAAFHSFKARRMMSAASRLQLSGMKSWGWGMGERCRWREEPVWKDRGGDCERQRDGGERKPEKVLSQKGEPARSHLCGIQALLPQAAAAQRPQPPLAWPGRVPTDTPVSLYLCPSMRSK